MSVERAGVCLAMLSIAGCTVAPRELGWEVRFDDDALRGRARTLEIEIREGGCAGAAAWSLVFDPADSGAMRPPVLGPGTYGFAVTARDATCVRYASGCTAIELPVEQDVSVVVTMAPRAEEPACVASRCTGGRCEGEGDAGVDAGPDARAPDTGPPDAGGCLAGTADCNLDPRDGCEASLSSVDACGACGAACVFDHAGASCTAETCVIGTCDAQWDDCNGVASDGCETSLRSTFDCGACGASCELPNAAESCGSGSCEIVSCHPGFADCDGIASTGCETSLEDPASCGACGNVCDAASPICGLDPTSGARACTIECLAPLVQCGLSCFDTTSSATACGGCGIACAVPHAAGACSGGLCAVGACDPLFGDCNGVASDGCERRLDSAADCGACSAPCASSSASVSCAAGACTVDRCALGLADCDGTGTNGCESELASAETCGSCGASCTGATPVCGRASDGERTCLAACAAPDPDPCVDRCVDTSVDPLHCGACGLACSLPNAAPRCTGGECAVARCDDGHGDCDGIAANGCESVLATDASACGACGTACPDRAGSSPRCAAGACTFTCDAGMADCDGEATNGCEVSLDTITNCGACGRACNPPNGTGMCVSGACRVASCNGGFDDCDGSPGNGCETRLSDDRMNCGTCGNRCTGGGMRDCCAGICGSCP